MIGDTGVAFRRKSQGEIIVSENTFMLLGLCFVVLTS